MKRMALGLSVFTAALFIGFSAQADDASAQAKLVQANDLYKLRTDAAKVTEGINLLKQAVGEATTAQVKYDVLLQHTRFLYWQGMHTAGDNNKIAIHNEGVVTANAARALLPDLAESYYYSASNLGRWAEAKGVVASLSKKKEIMTTLEAIFDRQTKSGDAGEKYESYGADRILGRLYFKLPAFAGGSLATALKHLDKAFTNAPDLPLNVIYYAEALASGNSSQKTRAKQILDALLAKDPNTLNPERVPEALEEFADARKLRAELGR